MLFYLMIFLFGIAIVSGVLAFTGMLTGAAAFAKVLFFTAIVLLICTLLVSLLSIRKTPPLPGKEKDDHWE